MTVDPDWPGRTPLDRSDGGGTRRDFVVWTFATLGLAATSGGCDGSAPSQPNRDRRSELPATLVDLRALLNRYFQYADTSDVREIGRAYVGQVGDDDALVADLGTTVRSIASVSSVDVAVDALEAVVRNDFVTDRRTSIGGWQLATTEARLCALVEFLASTGP